MQLPPLGTQPLLQIAQVGVLSSVLMLHVSHPSPQAVYRHITRRHHDNNKHPDEITLLTQARQKPMAWDVTVPDAYMESHICSTATKPGAAALKTTQNKIDKYAKLASTHIFYPFAVETAGTWHDMAIELTQEIGR